MPCIYVTPFHRNVCNLPFGALRNFNPHHSGHIVLWNLKLVVEFPAGASFFCPQLLSHNPTFPFKRTTNMSCSS
ncbi:hypothetical protein B0H14DRAFT_2394067 [Mycena olivaceomarginata]|nr:hypothetical protein B0H14DRAFT_2394067 [Mycena olivaceomarginata]